MNRFALWNHETLAKFTRELWEEHLDLREKVVNCTCGVVAAASSIPPEPGQLVPIVQDKDPSAW